MYIYIYIRIRVHDRTHRSISTGLSISNRIDYFVPCIQHLAFRTIIWNLVLELKGLGFKARSLKL